MSILDHIADIAAAIRARLSGDITEEAAERLIDDLAARSTEKLNPRVSLTDTRKALGLDPGQEGLEDLADRLGYDGPLDGKAETNIALRKLLIRAVAGGDIKPAGAKRGSPR